MSLKATRDHNPIAYIYKAITFWLAAIALTLLPIKRGGLRDEEQRGTRSQGN
uniref:Uncharacterized protein n=1 Tax=Arundo donax TaxID=35708 RepID=A0A0A9GJ39_ARUDO